MSMAITSADASAAAGRWHRRASTLVLTMFLLAVVAAAFALAPSQEAATGLAALAWIGWVMAVAILVLVAAEAFELMDLVMLDPVEEQPRPPSDWHAPTVSMHVPICSEPPDVVKRTLLSLNTLRYESFEVLVIDNNTTDERLWKPVKRLCEELGPRFKFFRLPRWPGYKAGALNFALAHTSPEASIVAVIDSDYEVSPGFLADLTGHFADDHVAFVQAPQNYRAWEQCYTGRMCYWEYWQFFAVSMRLRNRHNAILLHGTMVMIRKDALARVGGWAEWCLTEDSELGLRLLASGYRGVYCSLTYGRGLVPFSFQSYLRQRRRWVTGGVQTFSRHWRLFLPWTRTLSTAQKLHYLQGWAPWMRDGVLIAALPLVIVVSLASLAFGTSAEPVIPVASSVLLLVLYLIFRQILVYVAHLARPWTDAAAAGHAIFAMISTVGLAWLRGWRTASVPFHRTPKEPQPVRFSSGVLFGSFVAGTVLMLLAGAMVVRFGADAMHPAAGLASYAMVFFASFSAELTDRKSRRGTWS